MARRNKMARKKSKIPQARTDRYCAVCGKAYYFGAGFTVEETTAKMIQHYETKHSDRMSKCFDEYGQTWNAQYDAALKGLWNVTAQRNEAIKERDAVAAQQRSLAAKLNAIVMVLRTDS